MMEVSPSFDRLPRCDFRRAFRLVAFVAPLVVLQVSETAAQPGNTGGWAFYLKDGTLKAVHNYLDVDRYSVESEAPVPAGAHELKMDFVYDGGTEMGKGGTVTLSVDGAAAGTGKIEQTTPFKYSLSENQDVGSDTGTPVTYDYRTPFTFEGTLEEVVVDLSK